MSSTVQNTTHVISTESGHQLVLINNPIYVNVNCEIPLFSHIKVVSLQNVHTHKHSKIHIVDSEHSLQ